MMHHAPLVLVTGAHGFVGRHVAAALVRQGYRVRGLVRRPGSLMIQEGEEAPGNILDPASLRAAAAGCDAVIHLVGIIAQTKTSGSFEQVHVVGTQNVVQAAQAAGVRRYLHMSALGTRPEAKATYHQTKWQAEAIVRQSGLPYTIFRPSLIHGPDGEFTHMLYNWSLGKAAPFVFMPYFGAGFWGQHATTQIQPVYVEDVAAVFVAALTNERALHQTYPVAGPRGYTWPEMLRIASGIFRGKPKAVVGIPAWGARLLATLPLPMGFNRDQVQMSQEDNTADLTDLQRDFPNLVWHDFAQTMAGYKDQVSDSTKKG